MFILEYGPEILMGLILLFAVVFFTIRFIKSSPTEKKKVIVDILFGLAAEAEEAYGSKTGKIKKSQVIAWFYKRYPILSYFISREKLSGLIDDAAADLTIYLKENPEAAVNLLGIYPDINLANLSIEDDVTEEVPEVVNPDASEPNELP